ncbi:hypothetical protein PHSY_006705 [Pseudozyma hubeiensis SY62]|uniref:Transcription factor TFIIIC triple barrel domain-containing protein n=1 Tax=Pseudozyma hubeiensis (strain SY62) TaxID=1305764 RepID=R9PCY1_PSEHS|nr:hypothetical protein PHSY_006705 [Pseudozyma hubeiensis SY62]GAC99107.1 hypothetical protein PHSY_006705 [Pseudozyma hubeiensis SY62]
MRSRRGSSAPLHELPQLPSLSFTFQRSINIFLHITAVQNISLLVKLRGETNRTLKRLSTDSLCLRDTFFIHRSIRLRSSCSPIAIGFCTKYTSTMAPAPIIDSSWHRLPTDTFGAGPSTSTPIDPSSTVSHDSGAESDSSSWSFSDTEELITLDLGAERIAKRALLGYSGGLDYIDPTPSAAAASSSTRSVRSTRGTTNTSAETSTNTAQASTNSTHLGAGKHLSMTGLDTSTPLMKINDTVLRGSLMQMFGTEIVLKDDFDPTRDRGKQHRLQPIPPADGRANVSSSTTRKRILFRPLYDPKSRETVGNEDAYKRLQALATGGAHVNVTEASSKSTLEALTSNPTVGEAESGLGRGKYKRKEISEEEQMIRAAERKVRKAAKEHLEQQEQLQQQKASAIAAATSEAPAQDEPLQQPERDGSQLDERPPSCIEPNKT